MKPRIEWLLSPLSTPAKAWIAVGIYVLLLVSSADIVLKAYLWVFRILGAAGVSRGLYAVFAIGGCMLVWAAAPRSWTNWAALVLLGMVLLLWLRRMSVPADRIHVLQYGPLTLLLYHAARLRWRGALSHALSFSAGALVGVIDELVQAVRPERYFDWSDIGVDILSALLALALIRFVLATRTAPEVPVELNGCP